ncbi:MAG: MFS transporter [Oscillospiraceae bacterium]|nr:MFS transporter [Oscillospiraceae bacterium]
MEKLTEKRAVSRYTLLLSAAYMVSYLTRVNFGAVIYDMVLSTGYEKSALSAAVTGAFITYGAGQFVSGWLGDRVQPKRLMLFGLLLTTAMNLLIPICPNPTAITAVWCVNGFAQAFMWPPLVRLMTGLFDEENYRRCSIRVSWGSSLGTMALYLISPILISFANWKAMFLFSAICGIAMAILWVKTCPLIPMAPPKAKEKQSGAGATLFTPMMLCVMVSIVLMGALRDGVTTWMPTYIGETYNLGAAVATLTGVALPVFAMICQKLSAVIYGKMNGKPLPAAASFCALAVAACLLILLGSNATASVLGAAMLTGAMHGTNSVLIMLMPSHFRNTGHVSTISGTLNACVYIGSALSTYGFAALSESAGWGGTILLWLGLSVACGGILLLCIPGWNKKFPQ